MIECELDLKILLDYFIHNLDKSTIETLIKHYESGEIGFKEFVIYDFFERIGIKQAFPSGINPSIDALFFVAMAIDTKEKEDYKDFALHEKANPEPGSCFADTILEDILEGDTEYENLLKQAKKVDDLKTIIVLREINKYLDEKLSNKIKIDESSDYYRQFLIQIKTPSKDLLEQGYLYFLDKNDAVGLKQIIAKGLKMYPDDFWNLLETRLNRWRSGDDTDFELATRLCLGLEAEDISNEKKKELTLYRAELYSKQEKFKEAAEAFLKLVNEEPANTKYGELFLSELVKALYKEDYETVTELCLKVNNSHELNTQVRYSIKSINGLALQYIGRDKAAMLSYSDAIRLYPKDKSVWLNKLSILQDRGSIYYSPSGSVKIQKFVELAKENGIDLSQEVA